MSLDRLKGVIRGPLTSLRQVFSLFGRGEFSEGKAPQVFTRIHRKNSKQAIFLYRGGGGLLFMRPSDFIRLSGAHRRNLAVFRDPHHSYWHGAIHPDWQNIEATVSNQQQILNEFSQVAELYCAGTSSGAYAAILFGHYLAADQVHAFSALTNIDEFVDSGLEVPPQHRDLRKLLSSWNGKTKYFIYYSEENEQDRRSALNIAGCPGVELRPLPGNTHNPFNATSPEKLLSNLFPEPGGR